MFAISQSLSLLLLLAISSVPYYLYGTTLSAPKESSFSTWLNEKQNKISLEFSTLNAQ